MFSLFTNILLEHRNSLCFLNAGDFAREKNRYMYTVNYFVGIKPRLVASKNKVMKTNLEERPVKLSYFFRRVVKLACVIYE